MTNQEKDFDFLEEDAPVVETNTQEPAATEAKPVEQKSTEYKGTANIGKYSNPNVTMDKPVFTPRSDKNRRIKYQVDLAAVNYTPNEALEMTKGVPYYRQKDSVYDVKWRQNLFRADDDAIVTDQFYGALERLDGDWAQRASYEGRNIAPTRPRTEGRGTGERISGLHAMSKMQEVLGIGAMIKVPLWHSGFHVSIKAPSDIQLLNFYETIEREKISLGKLTGGLIFGNRSTFINKELFALVEDLIYETSIKDYDSIENLAELINIHDLPILAWALAYTIFPNGYPYARACLIDPEVCQHVTEVMLDIAKIMWVDRTKITEAMLKHMAEVPKRLKTVDEIKKYQEDLAFNQNNTFSPEMGGFTLVFKTATLSDHFAAGDSWIEELESIVRSLFTTEVNDNNINNYIHERANLTSLRNYRHFIKHVVWDDHETITDEESSIDRLLNQLSSAPEIVEDLVNSLDGFINNSPISLIAIPRVPCSNCEQEPEEDVEKHPWLLPLDPIKLFFGLRDRKLQQSIQR